MKRHNTIDGQLLIPIVVISAFLGWMFFSLVIEVMPLVGQIMGLRDG